jgi:gliding motility-associated lipoprotein GldH
MTRRLEKKMLLLLLLPAISLISCDPGRIYEENIMIPDGSWNAGHRLTFEVTISDNLSPCNMYLNIRNGPEYNFSNLYLFLTTTFPDGTTARDTIELTLAGYDGRWLGSGIGSVKFSKFLFKDNIHFTQKGAYRFTMEQAMRVPKLQGIRDLGLRIEKI